MPAFFYHRRTIYETMMELWLEGDPLEPLSVVNMLRDRSMLESVGGAGLIVGLRDVMPTAANAPYYLNILREKHTLREIIRIGSDAQRRAYNEQDNCSGILAELREEVSQIGDIQKSNDHIKEAKLAMDMHLMACVGGDSIGIPTGIKAVDALLKIKAGRYMAIAGRPGCGKTALCEQIVCHQVRIGIPVLYVQLDTDVNDFYARLVCRQAGIQFSDYEFGKIDRFDEAKIKKAREAFDPLLETHLRIPKPIRFDIERLRSVVRKEVAKYGVKIVYLDVFQQVRGRGKIVEMYAENSMQLREIAREFRVALIVLAHLPGSGNDFTEPETKIAWCDQIIKDTDNSVIVWSDQDPRTLRDGRTGGLFRQRVYLKSGKGRGSGLGSETLYFDMPKMTFYETEK